MSRQRHRTTPHAAHLFETLEPRIVLSDTYYVWVAVEDLPGYAAEYGSPDTVVGASDDGRFLWSQAAADPTRTGETDEPYLVADGQVRYLRDIPALADAEIGGINSGGLVLARDIQGDNAGRLFLFDLFASGDRSYLDEMPLDAPAEFDLAVMRPLAITDTGGLVLDGDPGDEVQLWVIVNQHVTKLWSGAGYAALADVNASNGVLGRGWLWTPETGIIDLQDVGIFHAAALDNEGWLFGKMDRTLVFWRQGEVRETELVDPWDLRFYPGDADGAGRMLVQVWDPDNRGGDPPGYSLAGLDGKVRIIDAAPIHDPYGLSLTESGILLNRGLAGYTDPFPPGGWYRVLSGAELICSVAEGSATAWVQDGETIISYRDSFGGVTRFTLDTSGELRWRVTLAPSQVDEQYSERAFVDPATGSSVYLAIRDGIVCRVSLDVPRWDFGEVDVYSKIFALKHTFLSSHPFVLFLPDRDPVIGGFDTNGRLVLRYQLNGWHLSSDLSQQLEDRGLDTPAFTSDLEGFRTRWGAMNIVGLDAGGQVHAVWWSPALGSSGWTTSNLSKLAGAPRLVGNLAASATPWGGMQIHGTDERGHLISLWWSPATGEWRTTDLTAEIAGPALRTGSLDIAIGRFGSINVVGATEEGEVVTYWWSSSAGWEAKAVIEADNAPRVTGPISYFVARSGEQHISGVDADGHVLDLYWTRDVHQWQWRDLTALAEL